MITVGLWIYGIGAAITAMLIGASFVRNEGPALGKMLAIIAFWPIFWLIVIGVMVSS